MYVLGRTPFGLELYERFDTNAVKVLNDIVKYGYIDYKYVLYGNMTSYPLSIYMNIKQYGNGAIIQETYCRALFIVT